MDYDLIVIGAGPAGLMASWKAAEKGLKVLVVEKKNKVDEVVRTTGSIFGNLITLNGERLSLRRDARRARIFFQNSRFSLDYTGEQVDLYDFLSFSNSGHCLHTFRKDRPRAYVFEVNVLLRNLMNSAQEAGVIFITGAIGMTAENTSQGAKVLVKEKDKSRWVEGQRVIAADGLNSRLAEAIGLNKKRELYVRGFDDIECPYPRATMNFGGKDNIGEGGGVVYVYPSAKSEKAYSFMTASQFPRKGPDILEFFTTKSRYSHWFKRAQIISQSAAIVTLWEPLEEPYLGHVLFIGDTLAFGEALVMGAIRCGYHAAEAVHKELGGEHGFEEYKEFWGSNFEWVRNPQRRADYVKNTLLYGYLTEEELDFMYTQAEEKGPMEQVGETSPYEAIDRLVHSFLAMPQVKDELRSKLELIVKADIGIIRDRRKWKKAKP